MTGKSVVQDWLFNCTFKQQTVLLSALRGCDGKPKEDVSKKLTRKLRRSMLHSANPVQGPRDFMGGEPTDEDINNFLRNLDPYPMHWLLHFTHATQIVGLYHPDPQTASFWIDIYRAICFAMHLMPEPRQTMEYRLRDFEE